MWAVNGLELKMAEGDFGLMLPITINGATFSASDEVRLVIKTAMNGDDLVDKVFSNIVQNTVNLELTESESEGLHVGRYVYRLDWYQDGAFMCNIIPVSNFQVVDKA